MLYLFDNNDKNGKEEENSTSLINNNYNTKNYESKINNK